MKFPLVCAALALAALPAFAGSPEQNFLVPPVAWSGLDHRTSNAPVADAPHAPAPRAGSSLFDDSAPDYYAGCVRKAHAAAVFAAPRKTNDGVAPETVVVDRAWLAEFATVLSGAVYQRSPHILAVGAPIVFQDENGKELLRVELLGKIVRLNASDYDVGEKIGRELAQLVASARSLAELRDAARPKAD